MMRWENDMRGVGLPVRLRRRVEGWLKKPDGAAEWVIAWIIIYVAVVVIAASIITRRPATAAPQAPVSSPAAEVAALEERVQKLEDEYAALAKSHALAIEVNRDLDERLARLEGRWK